MRFFRDGGCLVMVLNAFALTALAAGEAPPALPRAARTDCHRRRSGSMPPPGSTGRYSFSSGKAIPRDDDEKALADCGWFSGNSGGRSHAVGGKRPGSGDCTICTETQVYQTNLRLHPHNGCNGILL